MSDESLKMVKYSEAAPHIQDADLLLYRNGSAVSWVIRLWTLSRYSHVATAYRKVPFAELPRGGVPQVMLVDTIEGVGGRRDIPLEVEVRRHPGQIDWFAVDTKRFPEYSRQTAVQWALENLPGHPYGTISIWHMLRVRLPFLRLFFKPDFNDVSVTGGQYVCSTARAEMDTVAGVDPVPQMASAFITPGALSTSLLYEFRGTLVPD